ncbi:hypothetical protein GQ457_02G040790 [Hibiscus cannabinus]
MCSREACLKEKSQFLKSFLIFSKRLLKTLWLVSVVAALWVLWCARNDKVFSKKTSTTENCLFQAKLRALIWLKTTKGKDFGELDGWWSSPRSAIAANQIRCGHFGASFKFTVAVHMDSNRLGIGGIGGVLRDHSGRILLEFSEFIGHTDPASAELLSLKKALTLFANSSWANSTPLVVESDCSNVVYWIRQPASTPFTFKDLVFDCLCCAKNVRWVIELVPREKNNLADRLAKEGMASGSRVQVGGDVYLDIWVDSHGAIACIGSFELGLVLGGLYRGAIRDTYVDGREQIACWNLGVWESISVLVVPVNSSAHGITKVGNFNFILGVKEVCMSNTASGPIGGFESF